MAKTFDTSRVGGGTYELVQDANGNYNLKSSGFKQVNKLNLPDLTNLDAPATTTPVKTEEKKDVADPFKKLAAENQGDGKSNQDYSGVMLKSPEVKDVSVSNAGQPMTKERLTESFVGEEKPTQTYSEQLKQSQSNVEIGLEPQTQYRSDSAKFKERFDPTKIQAATPGTTGLQDVKTKAKNILNNSLTVKLGVGILKSVGSALKSITPEKTDTQKINESHFNVKDDGRIAGNPATDLYAGMNRTSDFGNLEKAGSKRINTREKTAQRKGYTKTNDPTGFFAKTEKMKNDQKDYKAKKQKTNPPKTTKPGTSSGNDNSSSDSGRVICTDLHRTGELSTRDWVRDTKFTFKTLSKTHVKGYLLWAEPTVKHMQKYPRYRKMWKHIAQHRANDIAWRLNEGKFDLLGRIYAGIGEPVCWALGNFVSDKQISKYDLTHWRRV